MNGYHIQGMLYFSQECYACQHAVMAILPKIRRRQNARNKADDATNIGFGEERTRAGTGRYNI